MKMQMTVILNGMGGELDRVTIKSRKDDVTSDDLAEAIRKANGGHPWILGSGDTIVVVQGQS